MKRGTCRRVEPLLALAAGDDLSPSRAAFVEKHLRSCGPCRRAAKDLADTVHTIRTLPTLPLTSEEAAGLRRAVWSRLDTNRETRRATFGNRTIAWWALAWAAAGIVGFTLLLTWRARPAATEPGRAGISETAAAAPPAVLPANPTPPEPAREKSPVMARRRAPLRLHPIPNSTEPVRIELSTPDPDVRIVWLVGSPLENLPSAPDDSATTKEDPE